MWLSWCVKKPLTINYTAGMWDRFPKWEGIILHVAASETDSLHGWFSNPSARASSHFYVRRDGTVEQYVSLKDRSWAQQHGNDRLISIETQGMGSGEWTAAQVASLARLCNELAAKYGFPLRQMTSSKVTEKGIGYHALGVAVTAEQLKKGVSQTGGELWSSARGKVCPGPERIVQIPAIIKQATGASAPSKKTTVKKVAKTVSKWTGKMASPVVGRVSCEWRGYRNHSGIDIACPVGTPVYAAYGGRVEKAGWAVVAGRSGYGIVVRNPDGEAQYYGHLSNISVARGRNVKQGQLIGYSGATGNVTGPHLHFETWVVNGTGKYGQDTNPRVHFNSHHVIPGSKTGQGVATKKATKKAKKSTKKATKKAAKSKSGVLYSREIDGSWGPYTKQGLQQYLAKKQWYKRAIDGSWGPYSVKALQEFLKKRGYYKRATDGSMGKWTVRALQQWLQANGHYKGYAVDGVMGARTVKALQSFLSKQKR